MKKKVICKSYPVAYVKALEKYFRESGKKAKVLLEKFEAYEKGFGEEFKHIKKGFLDLRPTIEAFDKQRERLKKMGFNSVEEMQKEMESTFSILMPHLKHISSFRNNATFGGKKSKRKKDGAFLLLKEAAKEGLIRLDKSFAANEMKLKELKIPIGKSAYYSYKKDLK